MNFNKKLGNLSFVDIFILLGYIALLVLGVIYFEEVLSGIGLVSSILKPFIIGFVLAFIINVPMKKIENYISIKNNQLKRAVSLLVSVVIVIAVLVIAVMIILPQLTENVMMFINQLPSYISNLISWIEELLTKYNISSDLIFAGIIDELEKIQTSDINTIIAKITSMIPGIALKVTNFTTNIVDVFMGLVMAIYMLLSKETLFRQTKCLSMAIFDKNKHDYLCDVVSLSSKTFENFFTGQLTEAIIIGVLCYIGCKLLNIPYASIAGVVIGCTNIIPIFGPIIGAAIAGLLILLVSPIKAVVFVLFSVVLQQVESNLIYPKVVGESIGLSALWVLFAVTLGGGLFGIAGMIIGLPAFSVIYELLRRWTRKRINQKRLNGELGN